MTRKKKKNKSILKKSIYLSTKTLFLMWGFSMVLFFVFLYTGIDTYIFNSSILVAIFFLNIILGVVSFIAAFASIINLFKKNKKLALINFLLLGILLCGFFLALMNVPNKEPEKNPVVNEPVKTKSKSTTPKITPSPTQALEIADEYNDNSIPNDAEWGKAVEVEEGRYTMNVGRDSAMGTPQEIYEALNSYRATKGRAGLNWDDKLASLARERVLEIPNDAYPHEGFQNRMNQDGFWDEYGVIGAGENASFGYRLSGVHLIEWMYAADSGHDNNQLNSKWNHVGIATSGNNSVLIFGAK